MRIWSILFIESDLKWCIHLSGSLFWYSTQDSQPTFHFTQNIGIYQRQTDGQTTFHFIPHIGMYARQIDKLRNQIGIYTRQTDRQTDRETTFHFIPHIGIQVRQTDKLRVISYLILESTQDRRTNSLSILGSKADRRTNFVSCKPSYWNQSKRDGQTF